MWNYIVFYALYAFIPLWLLYFVALWFSKGRVRTAVLLLGFTALASCEAFGLSSVGFQQETPEHAIITNLAHRLPVWLSLALAVLVAILFARPVLSWTKKDGRSAVRGFLLALPDLAGFVTYLSVAITYYGVRALLRP